MKGIITSQSIMENKLLDNNNNDPNTGLEDEKKAQIINCAITKQ